MQPKHPMHHYIHSGRTTLSYFAIITIKIFILFAYLPVDDISVSGNNTTNRIYEESVKRFIREDVFYIDVATGQDGKEIFSDLQQQGLVKSFEQPFTNIDLPYYRVEFNSNEDVTKRTISSLSNSFKIQSASPGAVFEVQQFSHSGAVLRSPIKLSRKPIMFSTQAVREPDFEWQWYTDEIGLVASNLQCLKMNRPKLKVAVIDNAFMTTHPNIAGSIRLAYDVADSDSSTIPPNNEPEWMHGSHSAGLIAGKKTKGEGIVGTSLGSAELYVLKATADSAGPTEITHGIEAFAKAIEMNVDVISLSWGAYMDFPVFRQVIKKAIDKGIVVIAAAGNYGSEDLFYPAAYDGVISIGAYDKNMKRADFSNYGDRVDIFAPGVDLVVPVNKDEYASTDGTSSAAPLFAGVYSMMSRYLGKTHPDLQSILTKNSSELGKYLSLSNLCPAEDEIKPIQPPIIKKNTTQEVKSNSDLPVPLPLEPEEIHDAAPDSFMQQVLDVLKERGGWIVAIFALCGAGFMFWRGKSKDLTPQV